LKDHYIYPAIFDFADEGISIEFPDLPGCLPSAQNVDDAVKHAKEAMALHLYNMEIDNEEIPIPTHIDKLKPYVYANLIIDRFGIVNRMVWRK